MPPKPQVLAETKVIVDRDAHAIVLTRTFAAPREQVFEAWTRPEHIACWWDPASVRLAECEIDLRLGGAFKFVTQRSPGVPPFSGIYREIAPPELLVFEAMGAIGRVVLSDVGGKTLMTVTIKCGSSAQLDQFVKMGVDVGTSQTLDNLVVYLGAM
ncbi:MAG: SRPBCC domain-containing protein [Methylocella sp.]